MRTLQEGIYYDCSDCTGPFFAIVFLRAEPGSTAPQVRDTLSELWSMYQELKAGRVRDLADYPVPVPAGDLQVLVGYGTDVFALPGAGQPLPEALGEYGFPRRDPVAGAPILANSGLAYAGDLTDNVALSDVAVQLTAASQLAVYRGVVETWKCLFDLAGSARRPALRLAGFFSGHQREDRRSWIDFHDGVNNLRREERERTIVIKPGLDTGWAAGGTYLAFARIAVDLTAWRQLGRRDQERLVGRDKLTGAPLLPAPDGSAEPAPGCPERLTSSVLDRANQRFREQRFPDPLPSSHIARANNHRRQYPEFKTSARIFRQGFEFLEPLDTAPYFRAGLNFVSFQDTPERLHTILSRDGWLGGSNFGGEPAATPGGSWLLSVRAAGTYLVPPVVEEEPFPGASILPEPEGQPVGDGRSARSQR